MTSARQLHWTERFAQSLIRHAARRSPSTLTERLEEEWLANLAEVHGNWARLRFAIGCCWATVAITQDLGKVAIVATGSSSARGRLQDFAHEAPRLSRRTAILVIVACLHAIVFYGLVTGLDFKLVKYLPEKLEARIIDTPRPHDLPPPPRPQTAPTRVDVPPPEVLPQIEPDTADTIKATYQPSPPQPTTPATPTDHPTITRVPGGPGPGFPSAADFYPSLSIHLGEQGVATVQACVDGKGRLTADPTIIQTTGNARLDEGALRLAKAGSGHYRAALENGQPISSCYAFRIRFDLKN